MLLSLYDKKPRAALRAKFTLFPSRIPKKRFIRMANLDQGSLPCR